MKSFFGLTILVFATIFASPTISWAQPMMMQMMMGGNMMKPFGQEGGGNSIRTYAFRVDAETILKRDGSPDGACQVQDMVYNDRIV